MTDSTTGVRATDDPGTGHPGPTAPSENAGPSETAYASWVSAAAGILAKVRRIAPEELPAGPEEILEEATYDGAHIRPLYTGFDESAERAAPGAFPYVRGTDPDRDVSVGWLVAARYGTRSAAGAERVDVPTGPAASTEPGSSTPAALNEQILDGLANGVSALTLEVGAGGISAENLATVLNGVYLDLAPVTLDAGRSAAAAARALFAVLDDAAVGDRSAIRVGLGATPLTELFRGRVEEPTPEALAALVTESAARNESVRTILVDGTAFHERGAADAQELAASIAAGVQYVRDLAAHGVPAGTALKQIEFRLAATDDQFATIAKFRAARLLWARVADVLGVPDSGAAPQHAVTSSAMLTRRDPWVNMLRTTLAAFGAGVGGADYVTVLPFDSALPVGALGTSQSFAERIARNTQLLLLEESHLGRVLDPAGGSWYVESLTDDLARIAWEGFQRIEAEGGFRESVKSGDLAFRIAEVATRREDDVAHRIAKITGVSEFPNLDEPVPHQGAERLGDVRRYAAQFEALRDRSDAHLAETGARPHAALVALGPLAEHTVRTSFAANLLASGGIAAESTGEVTADTAAAAVAALGDGYGDIAIICGTDARYADEAADTAAALRSAGVRTVYLAGPEKAWPDGAERPDGFLTMKIDAVETLGTVLDALGVK